MDTNRCLRCGTPHEPDAIVCFTCGAPIGETETPTNPVPIVKVPRPAPRPSGPAPATAPADTASASPIAPAATSTAAANVSTPRSRRRWPLFAIVGVLVLVVAGGSAYVVRALTAPPPLPSQAVYRDAGHRFHFQRPALWLVTATADGVRLTDSSGASTAIITFAAPTAGEDAAAAANALAAQSGLNAAPARQIGGVLWEQRSGQVTGTDGVVRQTTIFVTLRAGMLYTIELSSPVASYTAIDNLVYEPLLASFTFD